LYLWSRPVKQYSGSVAIACEVRKSKAKLEERKIYLNTVILDSRYSNIIQTKNIQVVTEFKRTIILKLMFTYSR
jgi:hypothetical protein